jgi:mannosyl-3-phosphoglycerate phosphatase
MTDAEFSADSGLALDRAALARQREFDEPFRIVRDEDQVFPVIERAVAEWGLRITRGARYFHLHGAADKGTAVSHLLDRYPGARSIGLGDSSLDLPLLLAVDVPVAVARPDGSYDETLVAGVAGLEMAGVPGPQGWSEAISRFVLATAPGP